MHTTIQTFVDRTKALTKGSKAAKHRSQLKLKTIGNIKDLFLSRQEQQNSSSCNTLTKTFLKSLKDHLAESARPYIACFILAITAPQLKANAL